MVKRKKSQKIPTQQPKTTKFLDINFAFAVAMVNTGQGFLQLNEVSAVLNIPYNMSNNGYQKYHNHVTKFGLALQLQFSLKLLLKV